MVITVEKILEIITKRLSLVKAEQDKFAKLDPNCAGFDLIVTHGKLGGRLEELQTILGEFKQVVIDTDESKDFQTRAGQLEEFLDWLTAGYGGMFGDEATTPEKGCYDLVWEKLLELRPELKKELYKDPPPDEL